MKHWWDGLEPILRESGDGQQVIHHFARKNKKGEWEYASVTMTDGEGEFLAAVVLKNGKATFIEE